MIPLVRGTLVGGPLVAFVVLTIVTTPSPHAVSESEGAIATLYLQFNKVTAPLVAPVYRQILPSFPGTVYIGCPDEADWQDFQKTVGTSSRWRPVLTHRRTSAWARDRFIAVRAGGELRLLVPERAPATPGGEADWLVAWDLARSTGATVRILPLDFEGGDIWSTNSAAFVHREVLHKNPHHTEERIRNLLQYELGVRVLFVDGAPHHLGMFMTPLDDRTVMVAEPPQGASQEWIPRLRALPDQLRALGFRVVLVPFLPTKEHQIYVTYTNVLIDGRTVTMPVYGKPDLDDKAESIWKSEGFTVRRIPAQDLHLQRGVIHCLFNVLERG